jgi:hypothetical protein
MLLTKEPDTIQHLPGASARCFKPSLQLCVLALESVHVLGIDSLSPRCTREELDPRFGVERAAAKRRELVPQMSDELLELAECGQRIRMFVA